jgi:subtilisin-like proprotein convertase family protein
MIVVAGSSLFLISAFGTSLNSADSNEVSSVGASLNQISNCRLPIRNLIRSETGLLLENALLDTAQPIELNIPRHLRANGEPGAYLIQSRSAPDAAFRRRLLEAGAVIVAYVPNNAYLVRASNIVAQALASDSRVRATLPYEPYYKLKGDLLKMALGQGLNQDQSSELQPTLLLSLLLFADAARATTAALPILGAEILGRDRSPFGPVLKVRLPAPNLSALARHPGVQEIEPIRFRVTSNDLNRPALGIASDSITPINYLGLTGFNELVSVNDTGVDTNHPDLFGRIQFDVPRSGVDSNGHGTHVAGIIAGTGNLSLTVTCAQGSVWPSVPGQFRGAAPAARLLSLAVDPGSGFSSRDSYLQETAAQHGAFLSNNSWNYSGDYAYDLAAASYDAAVRDALPEVPGAQPMLYVFAAGNCGKGADDGTGGLPGSVQSPATAKNGITVGAIQKPRRITNEVWECDTNLPPFCQTNLAWLAMTRTNNQVSGFSGRGPVGVGVEGEFGRFKPDVVAPGTFVLSTRSQSWDEAAYYGASNLTFPSWAGRGNYFTVLSNLNDQLGPFYRYESGTSLAAASVSGLLALMREFFDQRLQRPSSPALLKAMLINGARSLGGAYDFGSGTGTNFQGWGAANLRQSLPAVLSNYLASVTPANSSMYLFDQDTTQALATAQCQTRFFTVRTNAMGLPLRATLVWTDPPGNPAVAVKLVNNLDLILTNLDTGAVYFGNDIPAGQIFNAPWDTNAPPNLDSVNNVENIFLSAAAGTQFSVTVSARRVNVNAVNDRAGDVVQDYALVVSSGNCELPDALSLADTTPVTLSGPPPVTVIPNDFAATPGFAGGRLDHQTVGANGTIPGTNSIPVTNTMAFAAPVSGQITPGQVSQWHFYVLTNDSSFTNASFLTFSSANLALSAPTNVARPEPDIDLYVSLDPGLTNLDAGALSNAWKSLGRGGSETVVLTNAVPGVFYLGVKAEDQQAAEYSLVAVLSEAPFSVRDDFGNQLLSGFPTPAAIPDASPGYTNELDIPAVAMENFTVRRVIVTNVLSHEWMQDLLGSLTHGTQMDILNRHLPAAAYTNQVLIYDDSGEGDITNSIPSDGPGSLTNFAGKPGGGQWVLNETDSVPGHTGVVQSAQIFLERQPDLTQGAVVSVLPGHCVTEQLPSVPAAASNLTVSAATLAGTGPVLLQVCAPGLNGNDCQSLSVGPLTNSLVTDKSTHPPLNAWDYRVMICNNGTDVVQVFVAAAFLFDQDKASPVRYTSAGPIGILDDALTTTSLDVTNTERIVSVEVGVRIEHPRVSDLVLRLAGPNGQRILLAENRGGATTNGMGFKGWVTNSTAVSSTGGAAASTNVLDTLTTSGVLTVNYNFYTLPDTLHVYYEGVRIFDSGSVSNSGTWAIPYGPGTSTIVTLVMDEGGNTNANTAWDYTVISSHEEMLYATFTEDSTLTTTPVKFAPLPLTNSTYLGTNGALANGIFYLPEEGGAEPQGLNRFKGLCARGQWQLQILDNRAGATNPIPSLVSWQLAFVLETMTPKPLALSHDSALTNMVGPGQIQSFTVSAPDWASFATNTLLFAGAPVNLWFNQTNPPTGTNAGDFPLLSNATNGSVVLSPTNGLPQFLTGAGYFLGVQNTNPVAVPVAMQVDFDVTPLINAVPVAGGLSNTPGRRYFSYLVSTNATAVSFRLTPQSGNADLVARQGLPFPTPDDCAYGSFNPGTNRDDIIIFTNSDPIPLTPGQWYLGVFNPGPASTTFSIVATEYTNSVPAIVTLTNGIPYAATNSGPVQPADYYLYVAGSNAVRAQFATDHASVNLTLVARQGLPLPTASSYDFISTNPGLNDQLIVLFDTSLPVPLAPGDWFISAINNSGSPATYNITAAEYPVHGTGILITNAFVATNEFCLTWTSLPGVRYCVQAKADLRATNWTTISPTIVAPDYSATWCLPLPSSYQYFRIREGLALLAPITPVPITNITVSAAGVTLSWAAPPSAQFQVQWTASLAPSAWTNFTNVLISPSGTFTFLDDGSQSGGLGAARYYRLWRTQ